MLTFWVLFGNVPVAYVNKVNILLSYVNNFDNVQSIKLLAA